MEEELLERRKNKWDVPFEEQDIDKRIYPSISMEDAKTFIVIIESYNIERKYNENKEDKKFTANISVSAAGIDYHETVSDKLNKLEKYIQGITSCKIQKYVDISPFSDRHIALRAGLGFVGKNSMLINPKYGSRFFIGYLLTNLDINTDEENINNYIGCANCNRCIDACPTKAILPNNKYNAQVCISYLTQHKGSISQEIMKKMGKQLYGCDICQTVCPYNNDLNNNKMILPIVPLEYNIEDILNMTNKEFKEIFSRTAAGWRGKKWLQRNAIIALGNSGKQEALSLINKYVDDEREEIREVAKLAMD